jgi:type IV secretion system protein VirB9
VTVKLPVSLILAIWLGSAIAEIAPSPGLIDSRIRSIPYSGDEVYRLMGFVGYQTDLEFEAGESFVGLGAGDIEGISFVAQDNHLFLKPKAGKVGTNLTILTSKRAYHVDYSASSHPPDATEPVTYVLRFIYPPVAKNEADITTRTLAHAEAARPRNIDYWFCGSPSLEPIAASDDGVHTRLTFAAKAEQPAIFVLNEDSTESLLNFSMEEGDVIVHRVARRLILRRGNLAGCVVNKGYVGGGDRLKSNTVSENVEREVRGERP